MRITIEVNEETIELTEFPSRIIVNAILGMLKSLRDVDEVNTAKITLTKE